MNSRPPSYASQDLRHVFLRDMVLHASIGVHAFEHAATQRLRINVDLAVLDGAAAQSRPAAPPDTTLRDELSRVVDYEAVAARMRMIVAAGHVRLVETLAERLAEACLEDRRVRIVRIRVEKIDVFDDIASVGIEIERWSETMRPV